MLNISETKEISLSFTSIKTPDPEQPRPKKLKLCLSMLRPLVRILLRQGISLQAFNEYLKWMFVDVAAEEIGNRNVSRIAVRTGLTRKEVSRLIEFCQNPYNLERANNTRTARVVAGWRSDPDFCENGEPVALQFKGPGASFIELVRRYSADMTPRSMEDELVRTGSVQVLPDRRIALCE